MRRPSYTRNLISFLLGLLLGFLSSSALSQQREVDDKTWWQIRSLRGITTQTASVKPSVFVFFDPNCPYCAKLWESRLGGKDFSSIPATWIPVSYLGDSALGKAAFLLRRNNPEEFGRNFSAFSYVTREGGAASVQATDSERISLGKSKTVWLKLGGATPLIVYRAKTGEVRKLLGLPTDATKLADVVGEFSAPNLSAYPTR